MATHRKKSAKKRIRTSEFAVAAFLGLAVTAAPAVAVADTPDNSSNGASATDGSETKSADSHGSTSGGLNTGPTSPTIDRQNSLSNDDDDEDDDTDQRDIEQRANEQAGDDDEGGLGDEDGDGDTGLGVEEEELPSQPVVTEPVVTEPVVTEPVVTEPVVTEPVVTEPLPTEPVVTEPAATDPTVTEPAVTEPLPETAQPPIDTTPAANEVELPAEAESYESTSLAGSDLTPTPPALASALLDIDIVPKPPTIAAFAPLQGVINTLVGWLDALLPAFDPSPILNPTQVAAGWVMTLYAGLQSSYWNGSPTPITFAAYVLMTVAYNRYERLGTNHLPGVPTITTGALPLTWKLTSVDPDGDPLVYSVGLSGQPNNGLVTMLPDGSFTFVPLSPTDLINGTNVKFTVRVNDALGFLEHPLTPEGNDAYFEVEFQYPGIGVGGGHTPPLGGLPSNTLSDGNGVVRGHVVGVINTDNDPLTYSIKGANGASTVTTSGGGIVHLNADGSYVYVPKVNKDPLFGGDLPYADSFTIVVSDGVDGSTEVPVLLGVLGLTNPLKDVDVTKSGNGNGTVTGAVSLNANNNGLLSYSVGNGPGKGTVTVNPDGTYTYTATTAGWNESDTFTIVGTLDGQSITVATVNVVPKSNTAPSVDPIDLVTVIGGTGIATGNVSAHDADNDTLHYSVTGFGGASTKVLSNGAIVTVDSTGKWSYIPGLDSGDPLFGTITLSSFTVYVTDSKGGQASTPVVVTTHNLNVSVTKVVGNGTVSGGLTLKPSEQGVLTYSVGTGPTKGTVTVNPDGTYTYTRTAAGHTGGPDDSFEIMGSVGGYTIKIATVAVSPTINNVPPTAGTTTITDSSLTNVLGTYYQSASGKVTAFDADGDTIDYPGGSLIPATYVTANGGLVNFYSDGSFNYTIGPKFASYFHAASASGATGSAVNDTFTITVTDSLGASSTIVVSIPIEKLNHGPDSTVSVGGKNTDALGVVRGTVSGSDDDDDSLSYSLVGGTNGTATTANGGIVKFNGTSFTYIPTAGKATDSFQVLVNDGHGGTSTATVNLTGLTTPSPVTVTSPSSGVQNVTLNAPANDAALLTFSVGAQGTKGHVVRNADGTFTYTRTAGLGHTVTPNDTFTILGTTAEGQTVTIATVNVAPPVPNSAPTANGVTVATSNLNTIDIGINRQQTTTGTLKTTDADGDAVSFTAGTYETANGGSVTVSANGSFTYTSPKKLKDTIFGGQDAYWHAAAVPGAPGDTFTITASDQFGGSTTLSFSIPIETLNTGPSSTVSVGGKTTDALGVVRGTVSGSDDDGDALTYSLAGGVNGSASTANGGIVQFSGNTFTYIPTAGKTTDSFQVIVNDGHGGTATATISLTGLTTPSPTTGVNTSTPNVVTGQLNVPAGSAGLGLTYSVGGQGTKGTVTVSSTGAFTYTRNSALGHTQTPEDAFTIKATDANGHSVIIATVNVTPTVANANPTPGGKTVTSTNLVEDTFLGIKNGNSTQTTTGTLSSSDADGDTVTFVAGTVSTTNGGSVVISSSGTYTYTITKNNSYFHAAAKIGASGTQVADSFSVTITDAFNGSTTYSVSVSIYATNTAPTMGGGTRWYGSNLLNTYTSWTGVSGDDNDGDSLTYVVTQPTNGSVSYNGSSISTNNTKDNQTFTITAYDGYYVVGANGVVTSTPSSSAPRTFTMDQRSF